MEALEAREDACGEAPLGMDERGGQRPLRDLAEVRLAELQAWCVAVGETRWRAAQVLRWVHRGGARSVEAMTDVSRACRAKLAAAFTIDVLEPVAVEEAQDGTRKLLFQLGPLHGRRAAVETVLIPQLDRPEAARDRLTLCVSSQAGCGMGCAFCATARLGLVRNLRAGEIVGQVRAGMAAAAPRQVTNIVLMGMGEPLANYDAVVRALDVLTAPWGYGISPRRITVSTVGIAPAIPRFIAETRVNLAVSLHAPTDAQRQHLVPASRRYGLEAVLAACRAVPLRRRQRITFEYVMLAGENDGEADARALAGLLRGLRAKVNLIPFNTFPGSTLRPSPRTRILRFQEILRQHHLQATIRESRGQDIQAACGQLAAAQAAT